MTSLQVYTSNSYSKEYAIIFAKRRSIPYIDECIAMTMQSSFTLNDWSPKSSTWQLIQEVRLCQEADKRFPSM